MITWYLIAITYYGGIQPIPFDNQRACIEAREVIRKNNPAGSSLQTLCVKKG